MFKEHNRFTAHDGTPADSSPAMHSPVGHNLNVRVLVSHSCWEGSLAEHAEVRWVGLVELRSIHFRQCLAIVGSKLWENGRQLKQFYSLQPPTDAAFAGLFHIYPALKPLPDLPGGVLLSITPGNILPSSSGDTGREWHSNTTCHFYIWTNIWLQYLWL